MAEYRSGTAIPTVETTRGPPAISGTAGRSGVIANLYPGPRPRGQGPGCEEVRRLAQAPQLLVLGLVVEFQGVGKVPVGRARRGCGQRRGLPRGPVPLGRREQ